MASVFGVQQDDRKKYAHQQFPKISKYENSKKYHLIYWMLSVKRFHSSKKILGIFGRKYYLLKIAQSLYFWQNMYP